MPMDVASLKANLGNIARTYLWDMIIPNPVGGGDSDTLNLRCQSSQMPSRAVGKILVPFKASAGIKFPGKLEYSHSWQCVFIEGEDRLIFNALYGWQQAIIDAVANTGSGDSSIKTDCYLSLLDTDGNVIRQIWLSGCYLEEFSQTDVSYETNDPIKYTAIFSFDSWEDLPINS